MEIKEPYGFIYITTNMINGKRYIGQKMFNKGWETYLGSGIHLNNSIGKYGKDSFYRDIVAITYSKEELNKLEKEYISIYDAVKSEDFYNIAEGGNGGITRGIGFKLTEEHKKKVKENHADLSGKNHPKWKDRILYKCDNPSCKNEFELEQWKYQGTNKHYYCSKECSSKGFSEFYSGENNYGYGRIEVKCNYCGKPIAIPMNRIKEGKKYYCNTTCMNNGNEVTKDVYLYNSDLEQIGHFDKPCKCCEWFSKKFNIKKECVKPPLKRHINNYTQYKGYYLFSKPISKEDVEIINNDILKGGKLN